MAICALVAHTGPDDAGGLEQALRALECVADCRTASPGRIAATVEAGSAQLPEVLQRIRRLPGVWNLDLVYVNYEDDLDENGNLPCPPIDVLNRKMENI